MIDLDQTTLQFLRPDQFAQIFDYSISTVYNYIRVGKVFAIDGGVGYSKRIPTEEARRFRSHGPRADTD